MQMSIRADIELDEDEKVKKNTTKTTARVIAAGSMHHHEQPKSQRSLSDRATKTPHFNYVAIALMCSTM